MSAAAEPHRCASLLILFGCAQHWGTRHIFGLKLDHARATRWLVPLCAATIEVNACVEYFRNHKRAVIQAPRHAASR